MAESHPILLFLGTLAYLAALGVTLFRVLHRHPPVHTLNFFLILGGWMLQSGGLYFRGLEAGCCPVRNLFEIFQFVSWSVVLVYLITGQVFRLSLFGTSSATLAALLSAVAFLLPGIDETPSVSLLGASPWIEAHAAIAVFSYGIFGLLSALSALYLLQNHSLKAKRFNGIFRFLPSIMEMDTLLFRLLLTACLVFTSAVAIGAVYWVGHPEQVGTWKFLTTVTLWLAYLIVLLLRLRNVLYGTRLAMLSIFLFVAALLTLWPVEANRDRSGLSTIEGPGPGPLVLRDVA
ncbi:MAG: cytochrome C biogenesis protein [Verrucomicrobia bacterium]|jgi:ABC-type uncharacterized transport system permease subunit|nr:cytochrome C biogenesis protein [Verrucomicrobiota bacterium]